MGSTDAEKPDGQPIQVTIPPEMVEEVRRAGGDPSDPRQWLLAIQNNLTFHNATLLPAELLHDLARLDEGARARLIDSYQAQQAHRHALESQEAAANIRIRERAQRYALVIGVLGLVLAATLVLLKENATAGTVAGLIALVAIGGPVTANILARRIGKDGATGPNT